MNNIDHISSRNGLGNNIQKNKAVDGEKFSEELLKTVKELEQIDSQLEKALQGNEKQTPKTVQGDINVAGRLLSNMEGMIESFASKEPGKNKVSHKQAINQYNQISKNKT